MNKVKIKYSQTCDFCKKEVETDKDGLPEIWLPGYFIEMGGKESSSVSMLTYAATVWEGSATSLRIFSM